MKRNIATFISLAVVFSGSFALNTQPVEAKNSDAKSSQNSVHTALNYLVPPPPPYTPSIVPSALGMMNAESSLSADADNDAAVVVKQLNSYTTKYMYTRPRSDLPQVVKPNPSATLNRGVETKVLKNIDDIDSDITNHEKEIGKLLNL